MDPRLSAVLAAHGLPSTRRPTPSEFAALGTDEGHALLHDLESLNLELAYEVAVTTPVTASARPTPVAARRPADTRPRARSTARVVTAGGAPVGSRDELSRLMADAVRTASLAPHGRGRHLVASITADMPDAFRLGRDAAVNATKVDKVTGPAALIASGGICAPTPVNYATPLFATSDRPVKDALPSFQADRGGVQLWPPFGITDAEDGVGVWTHATDTTPGPATKPLVTFPCDQPVEYVVDAVTRRAQLGEFQRRFMGERVAQFVDVLGAAHSRLAETTLLTTMASYATAVTAGQTLGAARDVLTTLDRVVASMRTRHRLSEGQAFRIVAPSFLRDMIRADLARELPGSTAERLATADAELTRFLSVRNVAAVWSLDMAASAFGVQGPGALEGWPSTVTTLVYPESSFLFLDGGTLDLGVVRDSTLTGTNDVQLFAETFEQVAWQGLEALAVTMDLCPDGSTSATVDINPCSLGS